MVWLKPSEYENQEFTVLRLYAPESEKILLDLEPLKNSHSEPMCEDWLKMICELERDTKNFPDNEKTFYLNLVQWLREALKHTSVIVAEGNL